MLPGVTVVIMNTDTSLTRTVVTDAGGRYVAADLPPGPYTVKATMEGFTSVLRSGITMSVGRDAVADLQMSLGKLSDEVMVVAEAKTVDTRTASTGGLISTVQIEGLPLNGRSFVELANLTPGVQLTQTGGQSTSTGLGAKLSVNGSRYTANLFTLDGTNLNDQFSQAGSASGNVLGVEAVREFQVLTNSFSAEYGHHTGGIINAATKSGTNSLHGSVFEFHRDDGFDAKNYFDASKPPFTRNQFGYSVGGPILPSRTFFFSTLRRAARAARRDEPVHRARRPACIREPWRPPSSPTWTPIPLPNGQAFGTTRGEYSRVDERTTDEHYVMGRIDHQLAAGSQLFVRYTLDDAQVDDPSRLNTGSRLEDARAVRDRRAQPGQRLVVPQPRAVRLHPQPAGRRGLPARRVHDAAHHVHRHRPRARGHHGHRPQRLRRRYHESEIPPLQQLSDPRQHHLEPWRAEHQDRRRRADHAVRPDVRLHVDGSVHVQLARQLPDQPRQPVQRRRPRLRRVTQPAADGASALRPGRHPRAQEPHAQPRRALRADDVGDATPRTDWRS